MTLNFKDVDKCSPNESKAEFRKIFERLSHTENYSTVFSDFLEYTLLMLNVNKQASDFAELEKRWTKKEEHLAFLFMFQHLGNACGATSDIQGVEIVGFNDILGDLFMECVSFGRNGQFFTPQPVTDMMAMMNIGEKPKDGMRVMDCCSGSGRMLLSAAKINRNLHFYAADNDLNCVKMTAINFILNSMAGEVAHMNTLSMEHYKSYHIRRVLQSNGYYLPMYWVTGKDETEFKGSWRASQFGMPAIAESNTHRDETLRKMQSLLGIKQVEQETTELFVDAVEAAEHIIAEQQIVAETIIEQPKAPTVEDILKTSKHGQIMLF